MRWLFRRPADPLIATLIKRPHYTFVGCDEDLELRTRIRRAHAEARRREALKIDTRDDRAHLRRVQ